MFEYCSSTEVWLSKTFDWVIRHFIYTFFTSNKYFVMYNYSKQVTCFYYILIYDVYELSMVFVNLLNVYKPIVCKSVFKYFQFRI